MASVRIKWSAAIVLVAGLLVATVLALRNRPVARQLASLPWPVGNAALWLHEALGGSGADESSTTVFALAQPASPATVALAREFVAERLIGTAATVRVEDGKIVVDAPSLMDAARVRDRVREIDAELARGYRGLVMNVVVYQSAELDNIGRSLRNDETAMNLGITLELDQVGYHVRVPDGGMYVNPAWADKHHCHNTRIEGTGVYCLITPSERFDAYVHGDPELFVEPHPDAFALPPGRTLHLMSAAEAWRFYEIEAEPIAIRPDQIVDVRIDRGLLDFALTPAGAAAVNPRVIAPAVEVVIDLGAGKIRPVTIKSPGSNAVRLAIELDARHARQIVRDFTLASAGLHRISR
ncbi:MAG: hypothetical protein JWO36_5435 [Myxococcales bacterium]|nr:hypothetical protein [Myxococcales bacterium]